MNLAAPSPRASSRFIRACLRQPVDRTPIWLLRQAGRYMPEYMAVRKHHSLLEICRTPDIAAEVTITAAERLGVDAAIIFADLLLPFTPMGLDFEFVNGEGPVVRNPVRTLEDVEALRTDRADELGYVAEAISRVAKHFAAPRAPETPAGAPDQLGIIGFIGAPFTLASYMIEGGSSRNYIETKRMMYASAVPSTPSRPETNPAPSSSSGQGTNPTPSSSSGPETNPTPSSSSRPETNPTPSSSSRPEREARSGETCIPDPLTEEANSALSSRPEHPWNPAELRTLQPTTGSGKAWPLLMEKLVAVLTAYAQQQVEGGADVIQIFDSWAGALSPTDFREFVLPATTELVRRVQAMGVPVILFGVDTATLLPLQRETGADVLGLDWRTPLDQGWRAAGPQTAIQGNLDPITLFASPEVIDARAREILTLAAGRPGHIFNLGHGIVPNTPVDHVLHLIRAVKCHGQHPAEPKTPRSPSEARSDWAIRA